MRCVRDGYSWRLYFSAQNACVLEHATGNVRNFLGRQLYDGYILMMIEVVF